MKASSLFLPQSLAILAVFLSSTASQALAPKCTGDTRALLLNARRIPEKQLLKDGFATDVIYGSTKYNWNDVEASFFSLLDNSAATLEVGKATKSYDLYGSSIAPAAVSVVEDELVSVSRARSLLRNKDISASVDPTLKLSHDIQLKLIVAFESGDGLSTRLSDILSVQDKNGITPLFNVNTSTVKVKYFILGDSRVLFQVAGMSDTGYLSFHLVKFE